jgi:hypothetical protein
MLFADNIKLYTVLQDDSLSSVKLKSCWDAILEWAKSWQLNPTPATCTVMPIRLGHSVKFSPSYHIGNASLPCSRSKLHGSRSVVYDDWLSFSLHVSKIVATALYNVLYSYKLILKCLCRTILIY